MAAAHSTIAMAGFIAADFIAIRACGFWATSLRRPCRFVRAIRRYDRIQFAPFGLRKWNGKALVDLVAGLRQHRADDAGPKRAAVYADTGAGHHALSLPVGEDGNHEALVAVDDR